MADKIAEEPLKNSKPVVEYNSAKEFLIHEEQLLVQRFSTYLLATSILFLSFASLLSIERELGRLCCLKGLICLVGILGCIFLIGNMFRAGRARDYWLKTVERCRSKAYLIQELSWDEVETYQRAGRLGEIFAWSGGTRLIILSLILFLALWILSFIGVIWWYW